VGAGVVSIPVVLGGVYLFFERETTIRPESYGYVGSETCGTCHVLNYPGWKGTLHATMVQEATPQTVRGDFDNQNEYWLHDGVRGPAPPDDRVLVRLLRDWDEYYAYIYDPDTGRMNPYRITHTIGTAFRQTYLVESMGTFFRVPIQWSVKQKRWVNLWNRQTAKDETLTGPMELFLNPHARWNETCARCHTTGYRLEGTGQWSEMGIACEACHGPGLEHVNYFLDSKLRRLRSELLKAAGSEPPTYIVRPSKLDPEKSISVCAQCHQADIWLKNVPRYVGFEPGEDLSDHFYEIPLEPDCQEPPSNKTWPDTTPRGPGVLFRSFAESRCFLEGGVTCIDCHAMHDPGEYRELLRAGTASDDFCLRCHEGIADPIETHTHHRMDGEGSRCYGCHMPRLIEGLEMVGDYDYGRVRTHELDHIPYPESSVRFGGVEEMPNACNECHADQTSEWASEWATKWWGPRQEIQAEIDARIAASGGGQAEQKTRGL